MPQSIPKTFINELIDRCDIVELIHARVPLKKRGANFIANCPFHNEKTPSFTVSPQKQFYHCFGCGVSGNAISFLIEFERLSFVEAIEALATQLGLAIPREVDHQIKISPHNDLYALLNPICQYYQQQLRQPTAKDARGYLVKRGLTREIIQQFGIGFAPPGWHNLASLRLSNDKLRQSGMLVSKENARHYDRFRERIMFPIWDKRGRIIAFGGRALGNAEPKYLNSPETPIFHKGRALYGLYQALQTRKHLPQIFLVEGYLDVIALHQFGIQNAVATLGTAATTEHLQLLFRYTPEIVFCFDGDNAGRQAARRALENLLPLLHDGRSARFMFLPQGEDPDSLIRKQGKEGFLHLLKQALASAEFLLQQAHATTSVDSIDAKARLAQALAPLIHKLPQGVYKQMVLQQFARMLRLDSVKLAEMLALKPQAVNSPLRSSPQSPALSQPTPLRLAFALLVQNPQLLREMSASEIDNIAELADLQLKGIPLFLEMIAFIRQHPTINTGRIIEHWRGQKTASTIAKLATLAHVVPAEGIKMEFLGTIKRLKSLKKEQLMDQLLDKAAREGLDRTEREQLQALLDQKEKAE